MTNPQTVSIQLQGTPNFRDLGGTKANDGRTIKNGLLLRSEGPFYLTSGDIEKLHSLGIKLLCDLRSDGERTSAPNSWCAGQPIEVLNFQGSADLRAAGNEAWEALRADPSAKGAMRAMVHNYRAMPWVMAPHLRIMFDKIMDEDALPVFIHCTAGKDRTGFVVGILLLALGIPTETIMADYMLSARYIDSRFADGIVEAFTESFGFSPSPETVDGMISLDPSYLEASFASAAEEAGSIEGYLEKNLGLTQVRLEKLRELLLV